MKKGFPLWVVANLKMFFRDRTTLFWAIVFPILLMGLLGLGFGRSQDIHVRIGVIDNDQSSFSGELSTVLQDKSLPFKITNYTDPSVSQAALEKGDLDLYLIVPKGFGDFMQNQTASNGTAPGNFTIPVYVGKSEQGTGVVGAQTLEKVLETYFQYRTRSPPKLVFAAQEFTSQSVRYIDFLAPGIVAMSIMQNGVFGLSLFVVSAREKRILKRLQATPAGAGYILAGRIVPAVLISFVQTAILLSIAIFGFGVHITGNVGVLVVSVAFGALVFVCLGFLVSSVSKTVDSAESLTNVITLPMFFLGGVFIPLDGLPAVVQLISKGMPLTYFSEALRNIMLHGAGLADVWLDIVILTGFALAIFLAAVKLFRWE